MNIHLDPVTFLENLKKYIKALSSRNSIKVDLGLRCFEKIKGKIWIFSKSTEIEKPLIAAMLIVLGELGFNAEATIRYDLEEERKVLVFYKGLYGKLLERPFNPVSNDAKRLKIVIVSPIKTPNPEVTLDPHYWAKIFCGKSIVPMKVTNYRISLQHDGKVWLVKGTITIELRKKSKMVLHILRALFIKGLGIETNLGYGFLRPLVN